LEEKAVVGRESGVGVRRLTLPPQSK
jgi:hypothetical protein